MRLSNYGKNNGNCDDVRRRGSVYPICTILRPSLKRGCGKEFCHSLFFMDKIFHFSNTDLIERRDSMFKHEKHFMQPVEVEKANPQYAALLQEQLGGANGELKAAMQYMSQSFRIKDPEIKDLFLDIAAEELGHMEMVAQTINLLNGHDVDAEKVPAGEIQTHVLMGLSPGLVNASGYSWTGDYVSVTSHLSAH